LKKIVVYTVIFGAYDSQLVDVDFDREKFDFVCFTNQKRLKSRTWDVRLVEDPVPNDNPRSSYYFKTNPHKVWGDQYEMSIWMDSSCNRLDTDKLYKMAEKFNGMNVNLYIEKHPGRDCIYKELEANIHFKKDDEHAMRAHVETYRKEGMPANFGMVETGFMIRKHNAPDVIEFQDMLWNEMMTKTRRDQLSWTYCAWKLNFKYETFTFQEKTDILWFQDHPHRPNHIEKVLLVGPWYGEEKYEKQWADYAEDFVGMAPFDTVIVGCRPGRDDLYKGLQPDRFLYGDPNGEKKLNLLNGSVPRFSVKSNGEKEITQLNPKGEIFNRFKLYDGSVHFKVHIVGWKPGKYIAKCLTSLLNQKYQNWEAQVLLDPDETNESYEIAKRFECDRIKVSLNTERQGPTKNHMDCVAMMNPSDEDVCVVLDSDDWFAHDYVLTVIENEYLKKPDLLVTHGSWIDYPNPGSLQPNNSKPYTSEEFKNVRRTIFKGSHVRTIKYKVWKNITNDYLTHSQTGKYYDSCGDVAIMVTALEMAGYDRVKFIPDILYIYNRETGFNEDKVSQSQNSNMIDIMSKNPHSLYEDKIEEDGIDIIIFSKDRACQLDALLRSMEAHHKDLELCDVSILYKASDEKYQAGYDKLIEKYPYNFIKESNFKNNLVDIYTKGKNKYVQFFVDDNIWKNDFSFDDNEFEIFKMNNDILTLSLRLHSGITFCHPMNKETTPPSNLNSSNKYNINVWEWKGADGDWGYPMSVDGNIFRRKDIEVYVKGFMYNNPNTFEAMMANTPLQNDKMICYSDSKVLNVPMNRVQEVFQNPCGDVDTEFLNEKFLSGQIINIGKVNGFQNSACHQEIELEFMNDFKLVIRQPWGVKGVMKMSKKIDVFIVCCKKDYLKLPYCVDSVRRNIKNIDEIHICSPEKIEVEGTIWHDEKDILHVDKSRISHRPNWVYQQLLKLFQNVTKTEYYLTIDSDTIVNRPIEFFNENGNPIWYKGFPQNNYPYFRFMKEMFGLEKVVNFSFIADMNFFNKNLIAEMLNRYGHTIESFLEKLYNITKHDECYIGEPELYGNYVMKYHPELYEIRQLKMRMYGKEVTDRNHVAWRDDEIRNGIEKLKAFDCDTFSMHSWTD